MRKLSTVLVSILVLSSLIVIGILIWLFTLDDPIVYSYRDTASTSLGPTFVIFNPFRNKEPEAVAQEMLNQLRNGECEKVISHLRLSSSHYSNICEKEAAYRLEDWTLADRTDRGKTIELHYRLKRKSVGVYTEVFIELEKSFDDWQLVNVNFIY